MVMVESFARQSEWPLGGKQIPQAGLESFSPDNAEIRDSMTVQVKVVRLLGVIYVCKR
jgi:hypothetical protein